MKPLTLLLLALFAVSVPAQNVHQQIVDTERAFAKMVAEKGTRDGFMEFLAPVSVMFMPDIVNGRDAWKARQPSPESLTWNPVWVDVASNGAIAYSVGNSQYRAKGKDDPQVVYGHYLSVWMKQPNGSYRAELDAGINHEKPLEEPTDWKSPTEAAKAASGERTSAADAAVPFYTSAEEDGASKAYRSHLADDAIVMRQGKLPAFDKKAAVVLLKDAPRIAFARQKIFTEAADIGYVYGGYTALDKKGAELERGNFAQVWKMRNKKWQIVADILIPLPPKN
jgi:ketosteroid isomerase-like protein